MQICFQENKIYYIKITFLNAIPKLILIKDTSYGDTSPDNSPPITLGLTKLKQSCCEYICEHKTTNTIMSRIRLRCDMWPEPLSLEL